jgi:hypothetical protein
MVVDLFIQLGLDGLKQVLIENGRLLPLEDFALEGDFTAGNVILLGRDKGAEMVLEIQSTACRD